MAINNLKLTSGLIAILVSGALTSTVFADTKTGSRWSAQEEQKQQTDFASPDQYESSNSEQDKDTTQASEAKPRKKMTAREKRLDSGG